MGAYLSLHRRESRDHVPDLVPPASIPVKQVGVHDLDRLIWLYKCRGFRESGQRGDDTPVHHNPEKNGSHQQQYQRRYQAMLKFRERGKGDICRSLNDYCPAFLWYWNIAVEPITGLAMCN